MDDDLLNVQINLVKNFDSKEALEKIIIKMQPIIKKYARKLYFMERDDAIQELDLSLIEAIYKIKYYENEGMCLTYLQKSIINKYIYLCKRYYNTQEKESELDNMNEISNIDDYNLIELYVDLEELLKNKNEKYRKIIEYILIEEFSSKEISLKMNVSRQYINKIKTQTLKEIEQEYLKK